MNDSTHLTILHQTVLTRDQQQLLVEKIALIFKNSIDTRSPWNRPPGKAGLRAEKGYYRLLYLEGEFHQHVKAHEHDNPDGQPFNGDHLIDMLRQLADIPELRSEILEKIESALDEIITTPGHQF